MLEVADEVVVDVQVALVDVGDVGQAVHILQDRPVRGVDHGARGIAECDAVDLGDRTALGDLRDGEVELLPGDEVDGR